MKFSIFSHKQVGYKIHSADLHRTDIDAEDETEVQLAQQTLRAQGHHITGCLADYVPPASQGQRDRGRRR